jgi:methionyl-tRNA formyltransferase
LQTLFPYTTLFRSGYKFLKALRCVEHFETDIPQLSVREKHLFLDYPNGSIEIIEIKPSGKRNMSGKDFINGLNEMFLTL